MEFFYPVVKFFTAGGAFMLPILFVGAFSAAIAIERYITLSKMGARNRATWARVEPTLTSGDFEKARELTSKDESPIARVLSMGLALQGAVRRRDDVEKAMQESMMEIVPQLEKRTHYLATMANVATLLGLLGTVSGLIHAFAAVATVNPAEKANLLSASISEAMNCTAFGLVTAVPLLVVHAFLQSKTMGLSDGLETAAIRFLNALAARQAARAESRLELVKQAPQAASA
jgi:biopolymer transport protein ExbB